MSLCAQCQNVSFMTTSIITFVIEYVQMITWLISWIGLVDIVSFSHKNE